MGKKYVLGIGAGFGVLMLLLFFMETDILPYYVFYPLGLGGMASLLAKRNPGNLSWHYGIAVCIPMIIFWGFFITVNMKWNADKIVPMILTFVLSVLGAYYFGRENSETT